MWKNKGLLYKAEDYKNETIENYGSIPFSLHIQDDIFKIFFSSRNKNGKSIPYFINATITDGNITLNGDVSKPIMELGELGSFDNDGIMPCSIIKDDGKLLMYYIGWNRQYNVTYQLSIGLAISEDGGETWHKYGKGPLLDRGKDEPFFNTAPYVIKDENVYKMWYVSCTHWIKYENRTEPCYNIRYAESENGIDWKKRISPSILYNEFVKSIGRPCVLKNEEGYEMFFSHRMDIQYRSNVENTYKIGRSTSLDGKDWNLNYELDILSYDENENWDHHMREYCHVFTHKGSKYMMYNGDKFGESGFGYRIYK